MQQIKCENCETTRFFVHLFQQIPIITCGKCGAQFTMPTTQQEPKSDPVQQEPVSSETKEDQQPEAKSFEQTPEATQTGSKEEFQQLTGQKVKEENPEKKELSPQDIPQKIPSGMTPEEKEQYIKKIKEGVTDWKKNQE